MKNWLHYRALPVVTLLTSLSTLICCALPALMVTLGMGAALAGLVSAVPQLVVISEHKEAVFITAGIMLALSGLTRFATRFVPCPIEPVQALACRRMRRVSGWIFRFSLVVYCLGFFFAFLAARI